MKPATLVGRTGKVKLGDLERMVGAKLERGSEGGREMVLGERALIVKEADP